MGILEEILSDQLHVWSAQGTLPAAPHSMNLLYGRKVQGPLDVLRKSWTDESKDQGTAVAKVVEMREKLKEMMGLVQVNMERAQERQKRLYDRGTQPHNFAAGEQVLVLLPNPRQSLKLERFGPYKILRVVTAVGYEVMSGWRKEKCIYHVNLLKRRYPPAPAMLAVSRLEKEEIFQFCQKVVRSMITSIQWTTNQWLT